MRHFAIKELERLSGIKAHTIRTWEVRYDLLSPQRTITNIRYYTLNDLVKLLNIAFLINKGYKISTLAGVSSQRIAEKIQSYKGEADGIMLALNQLLVCMYREDIDRFETILDTCIMNNGIDATIRSIIIPFLERADILSYHSDSSEVHFVVTAIRKKIIRGIEGLAVPAQGADKALLFLFKDEHYDLMLLYLNYVLKATGVSVLYLGTNISIESLQKVLRDKSPEMLYTYIAAKRSHERIYANAIGDMLPQTKLRICHFNGDELKSECANIMFIDLKSTAAHERQALQA